MRFLVFVITFVLSGCFSLAVKEYDNSYVYFSMLRTSTTEQIKSYLEDLSGSDRKDVIKDTHNPFGLGVIAITVYMEKQGLIQKLVDYGADINQAGTSGMTALHIAASMGDTETLRRLLDTYNAEPAVDNNKDTILHVAVKVQKNPTVPEILKRFPDMINEQDIKGNTPLFYAVVNKDLSTITILKKAGAKINIKNNAGVDPVSYAEDMTYTEITSLLKNKK